METNQVPSTSTITQEELLMFSKMASIVDTFFKDNSVSDISEDLNALFGIFMDNNNLKENDEPQTLTPEYLAHVRHTFGALTGLINKLYETRTNNLFWESSRARDYGGVSNALKMQRVGKVFAEVGVNS